MYVSINWTKALMYHAGGGCFVAGAPIVFTGNNTTVTLFGVYSEESFCIYPCNPFLSEDTDRPDPLIAFNNYENDPGYGPLERTAEAFYHLYQFFMRTPYTPCDINMDYVDYLLKKQD